MYNENVAVVDNNGFLPFFDEEQTQWCKVYNDGGHYIAQPIITSNRKQKIRDTSRKAIDIAFNDIYYLAKRNGLKGNNLIQYIVEKLGVMFANDNLSNYVVKKIEKTERATRGRKKRFRRKAYLNKWNYFVTFTYDDKKQSEDSFRKKLRKCLSNLHTRRGWLYMGVFERAPETNRLHFHGIFYVPDGQMVGELKTKSDYSTAQGKVQIITENDFFEETFGRNDFKELNEMELRYGKSIDYLLKYIDKTEERIVYSRGIKTEIYVRVNQRDIVTEMYDFVLKYILFDDAITWGKDVMRFDYRQMNMFDYICNG